ncbi:hypothetical protein [Embleya scabrispora]|uniref:hypothetical protein n=1 Tax=Embleya scabrispora TaxID=159449 RepID=UPI001FE02ED3|nr:hypothetical protein [Embleya scabrispora]
MAMACLIAADRYAHLNEEIRPALARGETVVCDRYVASSLVLQVLDGVDLDVVWELNRHADLPDVAVILNARTDVIKARLTNRGAHSRYERDPGSTARECAAFREAATFLMAAGVRVLRLDASDEGPAAVASAVVAAVRGPWRWLRECAAALPDGRTGARVVLGDLNVLEPDHSPRYRFFAPFEYDFYGAFGRAGYADAFRTLHADAREYSWVGKTGDGYRYDHAHVSASLGGTLLGCSYVHEPRTGPDRLTDHSALTVRLAVPASVPLPVTDPTQAEEPVAALF